MNEHHQPFEEIRHYGTEGQEFWSARELAPLLDYRDWRNFQKVLARATQACEASNQAASDHFVETTKMVVLGSVPQHIEVVALTAHRRAEIQRRTRPVMPAKQLQRLQLGAGLEIESILGAGKVNLRDVQRLQSVHQLVLLVSGLLPVWRNAQKDA